LSDGESAIVARAVLPVIFPFVIADGGWLMAEHSDCSGVGFSLLLAIEPLPISHGGERL
jgi:hypothetical protein